MPFPNPVITDFRGVFDIKEGIYDNRLQSYIDVYAPKYARRALGASLYDDVASNSGLDRYTALMNGANFFDSSSGKTKYFVGLNEMLIKWIFFEYERDYFVSSISGNVSAHLENSTKASPLHSPAKGVSFFNEAVMDMHGLYAFQKAYTNRKVAITSIVDNVGTLTINTTDTKYLIDTDTVTINGTDYEISNVIDNVSFDITSSLIEATEYSYTLFDVENIGVFESIIA